MMTLTPDAVAAENEWRLVSEDVDGTKVWWRDNPDGTTTVRHDEPCDPLFELNRVEFNESGSGRMGEWAKLASVPLNLGQSIGLSEAVAQNDRRFVAKILNDPDYQKLRTHKARV